MKQLFTPAAVLASFSSGKLRLVKYTVCVVSVAFAVASCSHVYYAPNSANAPLLTEKGETRVNALYCSGSDSKMNGGELQGAYAVSNNVGVMANFFAAGKKEAVTNYYTNSTHEEEGAGTYMEFAGGYFHTLGKPKKWVAEVYAGTGFGSVKNDYGLGDRSKICINKIFVQPAIGYKVTHFECVFVPKLSCISWKVKESLILATDNQGEQYNIDFIDEHSNFIVFEPALLVRAGGDEFKFQAGLSFSGSKQTNRDHSLVESLNLNLGISFDIRSGKK